MNKLTQEFIRPYVEEWVKLKCPHYGKMLLDTVVNSTIGSDDGMSFALRNYIFGYVHADINKLKMDNTALQKELDELKELYRWHSIEVDGLPELDQDVELFDVTGAFVKEVMAGHFFDYEEGNDTSPDIRFIDHADDDWFTLDELENNYQWRYLNASEQGE